ncbi:Sec-independent protein translocase protein TatB [Bordetella genomosp. 4]|uniref:Sec-independent protein translocase protein TatB n=1 Tax=Bordetella genomosp. 4 TaxID=463044 RepID=A0A261V0M4_9BORD|nr:Sec-independent protein translocase protein TatB [Bordetella genomosp. 4]OZI41766.1 twin-arginine translocase subunit TatB [Bordetella genomosp. 4]OZI67694.1 twin-arginine translocase subunit TatB [Bordetella genomosp. 4]
MFDVSFTELMVIGVIALIVIGPERLPKVARTVGHLLGRAQRYVNDVKSDIQREIELDELRKFKSEMDDAASSVKTSLRETENSLRTNLNDTAREATQSISNLKKEVETPAGSADRPTAAGTPALDTAQPAATDTAAASTPTPAATDTAAVSADPATAPQPKTSTTP